MGRQTLHCLTAFVLAAMTLAACGGPINRPTSEARSSGSPSTTPSIKVQSAAPSATDSGATDWMRFDVTNLGVSVDLPPTFLVRMQGRDDIPAASVNSTLDTLAQIAYTTAKPLEVSGGGGTGLIGITADDSAFVSLTATAAHEDPEGRALDTPAGPATVEPDDTPPSVRGIRALVDLPADDWDLLVAVHVSPRSAIGAEELAEAILATLRAVGPPATTQAPPPTVGQPSPEDAVLADWFPPELGGQPTHVITFAGRGGLTSPTVSLASASNGSVFEVCARAAANVDDLGIATVTVGDGATEDGALILACRVADKDTAAWIASMNIDRDLIPGFDRKVWGWSSDLGEVRWTFAGQVAVVVIAKDGATADAVVRDLPADIPARG